MKTALAVACWLVICCAAIAFVDYSTKGASPTYGGTPQDVALHVTNGDDSCGATIIGPHAILAAAHCFDWPYKLKIYGQPVAIDHVILDGNDHIILSLRWTFPRYVTLGTGPKQGDQVSILGNPGDLTSEYRHGYVAGQAFKRHMLATLYDMRIFPGDSGSGIFNRYDQLVGVVSFVYSMDQDGIVMTLGGSFPLAFTAAQWREATQ